MKSELNRLPANIWKHQTLGKAVHNAITLFYHLPVAERTRDNLLRQLRIAWTSEAMWNKRPPLGKWGGFATEEEERDSYREAQAMLRNFYPLCDTNPTIVFLPTNNFKKSIDDYKDLIAPINDHYDISGKFDMIIKTKEGLHIIDFKTSKREDADNFQLRFYRLLAEKNFHQPVDRVSFYFLRSGTPVDFDISHLDIEDIKQEIVYKIDVINATKNFTTSPSALCKYCIYKDFCPAKTDVKAIIESRSDEVDPEDLLF